MHERQHIIDDMTVRDTWRMFHILAEFVEGFDVLPDVYPAVSMFGSARMTPEGGAYPMGGQAGRQDLMWLAEADVIYAE